MLSSISKLCNLINSFSSSFYEPGIFNALEVKKVSSLLSYALSIPNIKKNYQEKTAFVVFLIF